jgi:2-polyprenyl-6-hydroxyphenyl methylase/3-demethylubiquinone-9 3-methyltransferase
MTEFSRKPVRGRQIDMHRIITNKENLRIYFQNIDTLYDKTKNAIIRRIIKKFDLEGKTVLDVGCGVGYWTRFFLERKAKVFGVDLNTSKVKTANFYLENIKNKDYFLLVTDATSLNLKIRFDIIFAKDVIEHIRDDLRFLRRMSGLLKDDGVIIIVTQNAFSLNFLVEGFYNKLRGNENWCGWDPAHVRFYTFQSITKKANAVSLMACKYYSSYHIPYRFITKIILRRIYEHPIFHFLDKYYNVFPVNILGWSIICEIKKSYEDIN